MELPAGSGAKKINSQFLIADIGATKENEMTTFEQVRDVIVDKLGVDAAKVTENASFVNDLGADSLDVVEFVMDVESKFGITIPDEQAGKLVTVGDAVKYIDSQMKKPEGKVVQMKSESADVKAAA